MQFVHFFGCFYCEINVNEKWTTTTCETKLLPPRQQSKSRFTYGALNINEKAIRHYDSKFESTERVCCALDRHVPWPDRAHFVFGARRPLCPCSTGRTEKCLWTLPLSPWTGFARLVPWTDRACRPLFRTPTPTAALSHHWNVQRIWIVVNELKRKAKKMKKKQKSYNFFGSCKYSWGIMISSKNPSETWTPSRLQLRNFPTITSPTNGRNTMNRKDTVRKRWTVIWKPN